MQYPMIAQPQYAFAPTMPMMAEGGLVPAAKAVQSKGRNGDSMLVHMTPGEVGGLQALAMQQGGSLSINPDTGLPEANFLKQMLPTLLGIGGTFLGIPPHLTALAVGGIQTARTGDLGKGLMAGLGAYGGASLAGAFGAGAGSAGAAGGLSAANPAAAGGAETLGAFSPDYALTAGGSGASSGLGSGFQASLAPLPQATTAAGSFAPAATPGLTANLAPATQVSGAVTPTASSFMDRFAQAAAGPGGTPSTLQTAAAGTGLMTPFVREQRPYEAPPTTEEKSTYAGPYTPTERKVMYPTDDERRRRSSEFTYFTPSNPVPFSKGGVPTLEDGGFVLTKKAIDGLGNGDNKKGQQVASAGLGAIPIRGKGTGTSDSIKTSIEGKRPARVSNGEAYVPKKQVAKHGGAKKFYALMKKAERAAA